MTEKMRTRRIQSRKVVFVWRYQNIVIYIIDIFRLFVNSFFKNILKFLMGEKNELDFWRKN